MTSFGINDVIQRISLYVSVLSTLIKLSRSKSVVITMDYLWLIEMPDPFKTKDLCKKIVGEYVPNEFKTQEM